MWHVMDIPIQRQNGHIKPVSLGCELEIGMNIDSGYSEGIRWQRLHGRIDHVIAKGHMHLTRSSPSHTMTCCYYVSPGH